MRHVDAGVEGAADECDVALDLQARGEAHAGEMAVPV